MKNRLEVRSANPGEWARHKPDAHFAWTSDAGAAGRCSLWWRKNSVWNGHRVGMIGHYTVSGDNAGEILDYACQRLREQGCTLAVGPIDGSTWRTYRLITSFGDEPRFFLEPDNPPEWIEHFTSRGFLPLAQYFSALNEDLTWSDPRLERRMAHLRRAGITLRPIQSDRLEEDLWNIFAVSRIAFRDNLLYSEPDESEFKVLYSSLLGKVPLDLILLAEQAGRPVGFVLAIPDLNELLQNSHRTEPVRKSESRKNATSTRPRTVIVKTLAALPDRQYAGLGQLLLAEVQRRAHELGYSRAIHALIRDSHQLRRISGRYARRIREYTLFARLLSQ